MQRDIVFRGKRTDNGEWVEGDLTRYSEVRSYITVDLIENEVYEVDAQTVGQYTGLCDKNGERIFEGDIIKTHYANAKKADFTETVVFRNGRFCAHSKIGETGESWALLADGIPHLSFDKSIYMESFEKIGNIHDTPELIGGAI